MTTVGYIRVSSEEQARSGLSLENQERKIRAYAEAQDLELSQTSITMPLKVPRI